MSALQLQCGIATARAHLVRRDINRAMIPLVAHDYLWARDIARPHIGPISAARATVSEHTAEISHVGRVALGLTGGARACKLKLRYGVFAVELKLVGVVV